MATAKRSFAIILAAAVLVAFMPFAGGIGFAKAASKPAKVKGLSGTKTNQMVDLKWNKTKGAKYYKVYMKIGKKGKWKLKKTLKAKNRKLKINGLKWNKTYYFKVRAVNGKRKGKFSIILRAKIGSKKTLYNYLTNSDLEQLAQEMLDEVNSKDIVFQKVGVYLEDNKLTYKLYLTSEYDEAYNETVCRTNLGTSEKRKTMSNEIKKLQNTIGIVGITYTLRIYKSDESLVYSITYKKL